MFFLNSFLKTQNKQIILNLQHDKIYNVKTVQTLKIQLKSTYRPKMK